VERTQAAIDRGLVPNRSAAITIALESFLDELEGLEIDAAFVTMADDAAYRQLSEALEEEFAGADWEALAAGEAAQ
jgi:hypothetical protein